MSEIMARPRFESEAVDPAPLAAPLKFEFSGRTVSNRLLKAAITERMATWHTMDLPRRGIPTKELINVYRRWGEAGFGLMLTGNLMIELDQLESAGNLIIPRGAPFDGERFDAFRDMAAAGKKHGSLFIVQLSHPGRQTYSKLQPAPISASDVQLVGGFRGVTFAKPRPMEEKDFKQVIEGFAHAAEYAHAAGFDGVQLHAAHGYLLSQFLAHTTNKRTDQYGGSLKNRSRLILEIRNAIRARVPDKSFILCIKLNSVEFQSGGFTPEDCKALCVDLEEHGFDFVELSGGTYEANAFQHRPDARESTKQREAFFVEFADQITPLLKKTKTYVTGGLRTLHGMVKALDTVDGVGLARPICHEFDLTKKILENKVQGGLAYLLDERNYMLTDVAAGSQVRLVGEDKEPLDMTSEEHLKIFNALMDNWLELLEVDKEGNMSGWVEIDSKAIERPPYGTA